MENSKVKTKTKTQIQDEVEQYEKAMKSFQKFEDYLSNLEHIFEAPLNNFQENMRNLKKDMNL